MYTLSDRQRADVRVAHLPSDPHAAPDALERRVIDAAEVRRVRAERAEVVSGLAAEVVVVAEGVDEAADDRLGDDLVLGLRRARVAGDEEAVVDRPERVKVHRAADVDEDHRIVGRDLGSVDGAKGRRHDLPAVRRSLGGVEDVALVVRAGVLGRRLHSERHSLRAKHWPRPLMRSAERTSRAMFISEMKSGLRREATAAPGSGSRWFRIHCMRRRRQSMPI